MTISQGLLPEFDHETALTRKMIAALPSAGLHWKPHEKSWTLEALAAHLVHVVTWVGATVEQDELDMGQAFPPTPTGNREKLLEIFDANVQEARAKLEATDDARWRTDWTLRAGDQVYFTMPKVAVMRSFVMNHTVHHRAQLGMYLRLRDLPVPAIYGPSADDASF